MTVKKFAIAALIAAIAALVLVVGALGHLAAVA
jgi:hypothetical protein